MTLALEYNVNAVRDYIRDEKAIKERIVVVSDELPDIGVETSPEYRNRGLAAVVSSRMIQYVLEQNKKPVWACHAQNMASQVLAEKIGFEITGECFIVKKEEI